MNVVEVSSQNVRDYVDAGTALFLARIATDTSGGVAIAGWHNFFTPGRIGTAGSAVPLLFFHDIGVELPARAQVLNGLQRAQFKDAGENLGGWAILSVGGTPTVEATSWCMQAIALVGDSEARESLHLAERWLLSNQQNDGGWGSDRANDCRTLLTARSIIALTTISAMARSSISRAVEWLTRVQRPDGSWGALAGDDGNVFHTSLVVDTLLRVGLSRNDARVTRAALYLERSWSPLSLRFLSETYDVREQDGYRRVALEHDVDAAALQALTELQPEWALGRILGTINCLIEAHRSSGSFNPPAQRLSLWHVVPQVTAVSRFSQCVPTCERKVILYVDGDLVCTSDSTGGLWRRLTTRLLRSSASKLRPILFGLWAICILAVVAAGMLLRVHVIDVRDFVLAIVAALIVLPVGHFVESKR